MKSVKTLDEIRRMKFKFFSTDSKIKYILHWIFIYIVVMAFGFIITFAFIYATNKSMGDIASYDLQYYEQTGTFNPNVEVNGAKNIIFDTNGNVVASCPSNRPVSPMWTDYIAKHISKIQSEGSYYSLTFTYENQKPLAIVLAYPLDDGGVFLFFRHPPFLQKTLIIITIVISMLTAMMAVYMYLLIRMSEKSEKMQREYVDNISHELKSPLASVRALTTAMYDGLVKDENKQKHYCSIMLNEVNNLERTVHDMLELSRIQNHQMDCEKTVHSANDVFGAVIDKRKALCEDLNIDLRLSPALSEYPDINTNKLMTSRLLDILLDNAIKFTPVDGHVHLFMTYNQKQLTITVRDSGPGIAPEDKDHIFERFYKCDKAHNEKGSGLGLAIAKEIADSLDEKLWLNSTRPEGAEFSFTIQKG